MEKDTKGLLEVRVLDRDDIDEFPELAKEYKASLENYYTFGVLVVLHNGEVIFNAGDGFEPEDATFERDLWWITNIIQKAYKLGFEDGAKSAKKD